MATDEAEVDRPLADWLARIEAAERSGDLLMAADLAASALEQHPDDDELKYHHLLSLARAGGLSTAEHLWERYRLPAAETRYAALGARLSRERGFRGGAGAGRRLVEAASAYGALFRDSGNPFPGTNAAALFALAGEEDAAADLARRVLAAIATQPAETREARFNLAADEMIAALILDDRSRATAALERLLANGGNAAASGSTRRLLQRLVSALGRGEALLARLAPRASLHYTGHMAAPPDAPRARFPAEAEAAVAAEIETRLAALEVGAGFGSLAAGGDILVAEALARRGVPLTVVLPFDRESFVETSVRPSGEAWVPRFERLLAGARRVVQATEGPHLGDDGVYGYATRLAMGLASLRGAIEGAACRQLAVWDGAGGNGVAGTAADIAAWRALGHETTVVSSRPRREAEDQADAAAARRPAPQRPALPERPLRALFFGDFRGFGRLGERQLLAFNARVLALVAAVLDAAADDIELRQTWGDGLLAVFRTPARAAETVLRLQEALAGLDRAALGLPADFGLRAALHAGPVFRVQDPVTRQPGYVGRHISRTARMEPVTPAGEVYVSEDFAALLALEPGGPVAYEYVGRMPLAKEAGQLRMYLLRRAEGG